LEDRGVPRKIELHHRARGRLKVEADAPRIRRQKEPRVRVVVERRHRTRATRSVELPVELEATHPTRTQLRAKHPLEQRRHPPPLAEHDDLLSRVQEREQMVSCDLE